MWVIRVELARTCNQGSRHREHFKARWRDPEGRTRSKVFHFERDAKAFLRALGTSRDQGTYVDPHAGKITLREFFPRFIDKSHLRPATLAQYRSLAGRHILPALGARKLNTLTRLDLQGWVSEVGADSGVATTRAAFRVLRRLLSAAVADYLIGKNPAQGVSLPQEERREMRALTSTELQAIVAAVPHRERALVLLLGLGGLRIGEALALTVEDFVFLRRTVRVTKAVSEVAGRLHFGEPKTRAGRRSVKLPAVVVDAIAEHIATHGAGEGGLIFTSPNREPIRRTNWRRRVWLPALRRAGIARPWPRVHDLRHTAAALAIEAGAHPKAIQEMLGHSSIAITMDVYGHLLPSLAEDVADRVGAAFLAATPPRHGEEAGAVVEVLRT